MSVQSIGLIGMGVLVLMIFLRVPVAISMGLVGLCGYAAVAGWDRAVRVLGQVPFDVASGYDLSVVPMFVLMGELATRSGMSAKLYNAARAFFVGFRGAQALATLGACAAFGAVCGSSLATAATMTRIAIPQMRRLGYDDRLSTGAVAAGGSLGILIPPSIPLVIYAIIAEQSVAKLFAAGMIPGLVLTALYMLMVVAVLIWKPGWAPTDPGMSWRERFAALGSIWSIAILFGVAIGGLYAGWFTPTEAAAIGAFGAWGLGALGRGLSLKQTWAAFTDTIRTTCMLFMIVICAVIFSYFVVQTQLPDLLVSWMRTIELGPVGLMLIIIAFYVVMGCFLDGFGMILITVPVFLPLIVQSGWDPIWFGVILVVVIELGLIHPPVGMNIFVIQAQVPDVPVLKIYQGIIPFLVAPFLLLGLLLAFPDIALWLPQTLFPPR
ncbi:MAG TPA: TRAP transporter large permease [Alphaproteobacteria bacterium]